MAQGRTVPLTFILTDSRGLGLDDEMRKLGVENFRVFTRKGSGIELAVTMFLSDIVRERPDLVIITNGLCDLTYRNRITKITGLVCQSVDEATTMYQSKMQSAYSLIQSVSGTTSVVFAPVTGVDLTDYNNTTGRHLEGDALQRYHAEKHIHPLQPLLNETIIAVNRLIATFNEQNNMLTPWTANIVHKYYNHKYHHCYHNLADGCHLTTTARCYWAKHLHKCILKTFT